ncbi:DUF192 domain-containing protein [Candidatus Saccharibacteria bacterium]|nr:DUF192 domain-containing protein [Candidatus Saccharibacteria bacterium]MCB9820994.1 DUF192 domain-containing protein [Candidatus Nomurabacteria bacterium]
MLSREIVKIKSALRRSNRVILLIVVLAAIGVASSLLLYQQSISTNQAQPTSLGIHLEYAITSVERSRGLSGRPTLDEESGMLFVFESENYYSFWMKDMNFPLDIIWMDSDFRIVDIVYNAPPAGSMPEVTYTSDKPAKYVLEINAGQAQARGYYLGNRLNIDMSSDTQY